MPPKEQQRCILWQMWANESALLASYLLVMGGTVALAGTAVDSFSYWKPIGIYAIVAGFLIALFEYPRGEKTKGRSLKRSHQDVLTRVVEKVGFMSHYSARALVYFILAVPTLLCVPTVLGGLTTLFSCIIYVKALSKGEAWKAIKPKKEGGQQAGPSAASAPQAQAPRRPPPKPTSSSPVNSKPKQLPATYTTFEQQSEQPRRPPPALPQNDQPIYNNV